MMLMGPTDFRLEKQIIDNELKKKIFLPKFHTIIRKGGQVSFPKGYNF